MKNTKYIIAAIALAIVMFFAATDPQAAVAQIDSGRNVEASQQNYYHKRWSVGRKTSISYGKIYEDACRSSKKSNAIKFIG